MQGPGDVDRRENRYPVKLAKIGIALVILVGVYVVATRALNPVIGALSGAPVSTSPTPMPSEAQPRNVLCAAVAGAEAVMGDPATSERVRTSAGERVYDAASTYVGGPSAASPQLIGDMLRYTSDFTAGSTKAWRRDLKVLVRDCRSGLT
jgi:hypothetical protein